MVVALPVLHDVCELEGVPADVAVVGEGLGVGDGVGVGVGVGVGAGVGVGVGVGAGVEIEVCLAGAVLAMVLVALWVLAAPPLTLGWTLMSGLTVMFGEKLMTAVAMARSCPEPIRPREDCPWP